ncbi:rhodanese-like domain-containing protein [Rhodococcus ruber]|uniref:rhodanese-like domain-containing protein n=1 Tax=Rhodococcus ruber TaxID=1830 RepID=UPI001F361917|nr:rhodanese-like domain-containing protein [Rhodococcus ruber]
MVVDIRSHAERAAQGTLPGALAISAELLPRRLHPADDERLAVAVDRDVEWVVVSASGAETDAVVAGLQALGLRRVTGLVGGYAALAAAGATGAIAAAPHVEDDVARVTAH